MDKPFARRIVLATAAFIGTQFATAVAQTIYDDDELAERASMYEDWIAGVFKEDLIERLPDDDLSDVEILTPSGVVEDEPLTVATDVPQRVVVLPIQTVAFLDDMAALSAWLTWNNCSQEPVTLYGAMLTATDPPSSDGFYPTPRSAFGLDDTVWDDQRVKDSSNQIFNTAVYFVLAHELGHVKYQHPRYDTVSQTTAQQNEMQADVFALESMRNIGMPPIGMIIYFMMQSRMESGIPKTHPLSGTRVSRITTALRETPEDFVPPGQDVDRWARVIGGQAALMDSIIGVIDNPQLRDELSKEAHSMTWLALRQSCGKIEGIR